jgi:hypothetical protein
MPISETPTNPTETERPAEPTPSPEEPLLRQVGGYSSSRWVDYDTHELLEKLSEYEDERRWQRIREGIWISIILHILFFSALTWIPKYVFHAPQVIDPFDAIKNRKDLTYLDELPEALREIQKSKVKPPPPPKQTAVDKKTLDALKAEEEALKKLVKPTTPPPPTPEEKTPQPTPVPQTQQAPATVAPPVEKPPLAFEQPRQAPVPARPPFSMGSQNPADQLREAMREAAHNQSGGSVRGGSLGQHTGAAGGAQIISDTQGVDFGPWLQKVVRETYRTWDPLIPEEVNPPISKRGEVEIVFTVLPNGRIQPGGMIETGRSGDVALDRAAWGAITSADYPPLPREFHGSNIQLRFRFTYNMDQ